MPAGAGRETPPLLTRIRSEIEREGPVTFARFMELALYDPDHGYYSGGPDRIGVAGDYFTASDVGRAFGRCTARQIIEIDRLAGPFDPFHVIEFGAGRGLLARDVLASVSELDPGLSGRLRYLAVDRSAAMRSAAEASAPAVRAAAPEEVGRGHRGCLVAVELFDALPAHRVRRRDGELVEILVDVGSRGELEEREGSPSAEVAAWAARYGAAPEEGWEAEVCPASARQIDAMAEALEAGVILIVDYGDRAEDLYAAKRRRGTLLAYRTHTTSETLLERVGEQDLTAHVNFTALEDRARERGMQVLGLTTQDRYLVANGILEEFDQQSPEEIHDPRRVKARMQAMQLIHPLSMGRTFKVLLLSKGIEPAPVLSGTIDPFARRALS
jgi:SAM-dependent MidA family methyltransferase